MVPYMRRALFLAAILACAMMPRGAFAAEAASAETTGKTIKVSFNGKPFAGYYGEGYAKPVIYPIIGPHGIQMTRDWPMKDGTPGEAKDHPHQKSLWYTHGDVNGVDFWAEGAAKGKIAQDGAASVKSGGKDGIATVKVDTRNKWLTADDKTVLTDERSVTFMSLGNDESAIDFQITLIASHGDVKFGDTKEGTMGIRTNPALHLKGTGAKGKAVNSEGVGGAAIWGKQAKWVDYWAEIDGKTVGVAIFDHPGNPRHPTHWHARDYGLIAVNPFGIGNFEKGKPKNAGEMVIKNGDKATFKYRFLFHKGDAKEGKIADRFAEFAK